MGIEVDLSRPLTDEEIEGLKARLPLNVVNRYIEIANGPQEGADEEQEPQGSATEDDDSEDQDDPDEDPDDADAEDGDDEDEEDEDELFDPNDHDVAQVKDYLMTASEEETLRVLGLEESGKARKSILND